MLDFYQKNEDIPPEFVKEEQSIEDLLHNKAEDNLSEGYKRLNEEFNESDFRSEETVEAALALLALFLRRVQTYEVDNAYARYVDAAIHSGSLQSGWGKRINSALNKESVMEGIVKASGYYTNKFFNDVVIPKIEVAVQKVLREGADPRVVYNTIRETIDKHYKSVHYWRLVANNSASRAFHYGLTKGGMYMNYTTVRYDAVMDNRTSQICRKLNGTEWSIGTAVNIYERSATGKPEDLEEYSPWLKASEYDMLSNREMEAAGVIIPPRHPFCRSVLSLL